MNDPRPPRPLIAGLPSEPVDGAALDGASEGRWLWQGRFGSMLIELRRGQVFVNGQRVEPARSGEGGSDTAVP